MSVGRCRIQLPTSSKIAANRPKIKFFRGDWMENIFSTLASGKLMDLIPISDLSCLLLCVTPIENAPLRREGKHRDGNHIYNIDMKGAVGR